jgi:hypothetical protein
MLAIFIDFFYPEVYPEDFNSFRKMNLKNPTNTHTRSQIAALGLGSNSRVSLYRGTNENRELIRTLKIDKN